MVSILMPVYNAADTLEEALASVRRQTCQTWELVAVDDGSTDATGAILDQAAAEDPRIRPLHRPHAGLVPALNAGLAECRGEWLARFDGDDLMHPERIARQRDANHDGVLGCGVETFPRDQVSEGLERYETWLNGLVTHEQIVRDLFVESPLAHPSVMLPTELLRRVDGYRDCGWPEDYDLWLRLWQAGARFRKLPETLHHWRDHPDRLTRGGGVYGRTAFRRCKVAHLKTSYLAERPTVIVWGAGKIGRFWSRSLTQAGLQVRCHIDERDEWIGKAIRGRPVHGPEFLETRPDELILLTIGVFGERERLRRLMAERGYVEGRDYLCVG